MAIPRIKLCGFLNKIAEDEKVDGKVRLIAALLSKDIINPNASETAVQTKVDDTLYAMLAWFSKKTTKEEEVEPEPETVVVPKVGRN